MSDLDISALLHLMGRILLAVLEFTLSIAPIGLLALIAAYLFTFEDRSHFFQAKMPRTDAIANTHVGLMVAHGFLTFFYAMLCGVDGMSALAVISYSVCTVWAVCIGLGLGGLILGTMWHLFETHVLKKTEGQSGSYEAVSTTNEHELESSENEPAAKDS